MSEDFNSCDLPGHTAGLISLEAALDRILADCAPLGPAESIALPMALGRVLARPLLATLDLPPFDNSAMDGYALRAADTVGGADAGKVRLRLLGTSAAGSPFGGRVEAGGCVRIMTGAAMPEGADAVVIQEVVELEGDTLILPAGIREGANVRRSGEDMRAGATIIEAGKRLLAPQIAAAAATGTAELSVWRRPRVAFFSTGDELRPLGSALGPGEIFDSNRYALRALLERLDIQPMDLGVIADRPEAVREALAAAAASCDVVLTTGGVSVGDADYVKQEVERLGELSLWRIAMKPGKPLAVGRIEDARFFGLPGNPVSAVVTFYQLVAPALRRLAGELAVTPLSLPARTETPLAKRPGRTEFQRGRLRVDSSGELWVAPAGAQGSHVLSALSAADCLIVLPRDAGDIAQGARVFVQPFEGLS